MNHVIYTPEAPKPVTVEAPKENFVWVLTFTTPKKNEAPLTEERRAFRNWAQVEQYKALYHRDGSLDGKNPSSCDLINAEGVIVGEIVRTAFWL